jgi:hypothetical protein
MYIPGVRLNRVHHGKLCCFKKPHSSSVKFIFLSEWIMEILVVVLAVCVYKALVTSHAIKRRAVESAVETCSWRTLYSLEGCALLSTNSSEVFIRNSYPIFQPIENFIGSHFGAVGGKEAVFLVLFNPV